MEIDGKRRAFVERAGSVFEHLGVPPTAGRMLGVLLIAPEPLSLEELARLVRVSKPAMSNHVRLYRQIGLIQRLRLPGDRKDYYEVRPSSFEQVMERRLDTVKEIIDLMNEGLDLSGHSDEQVRERLVRTQAFYRFVGGRMREIMSEWEVRKPDILTET